MRHFNPATVHLTGAQDFGVQVALDVDGPAIGQLRTFRHNANELQLPAAEQPAFRAQVIDQISQFAICRLDTG